MAFDGTVTYDFGALPVIAEASVVETSVNLGVWRDYATDVVGATTNVDRYDSVLRTEAGYQPSGAYGVWGDSAKVGYLNFPLPSTHSTVTIEYGHGHSSGDVKLCLCTQASVQCDHATCTEVGAPAANTRASYTTSYTPGQALNLQEGSSTLDPDITIVLSNPVQEAYTVTFPSATTGQALVVSGSEYKYFSGLDLSGEYTVTVGTDTSVVTDAAGVNVATSAGGNVYSQTFDFTGKDTKTEWEDYAEEIGGTVSFESYQENTNIAGEYLMWSGSETVGYFELPLPAGYNSVTIAYGSGGWEWGALSAWAAYADKMYVKLCLCSSGGNECTHASCDVIETIQATYQVPKTSTQTMTYTAGQVLRVEEKMLTVDMNMIIVLKNIVEHDITGVLSPCGAPQVVVKYNAIVCPSDTDTEPKCDEGFSVFSFWSIRKC